MTIFCNNLTYFHNYFAILRFFVLFYRSPVKKAPFCAFPGSGTVFFNNFQPLIEKRGAQIPGSFMS